MDENSAFIFPCFTASSLPVVPVSEKSISLGSAAGAVAGGINGALLLPTNTKKGIAKGALIGGVIGGLLGYSGHKHLEKRRQQTRRETLLNLNRHGVLNPPPKRKKDDPWLTRSVVGLDWVEPRIHENKFVEGHKVWKILELPQWIHPQEIKQKRRSKNGK